MMLSNQAILVNVAESNSQRTHNPDPDSTGLTEASGFGAEPANETTNINSLPDVDLRHIFSYCGLSDRIWGRLVCTRWNGVISTDPGFLRRTVFRIESDTTAAAVLQNSTVHWKHLLLECMFDSETIEVPLYLRNQVETVQIVECDLTNKALKEIIVQFPCLEVLKLEYSDLVKEKKDRNNTLEMVKAKALEAPSSDYVSILNGLRTLNLSGCSCKGLIRFLDEFIGHTIFLSKLSIKLSYWTFEEDSKWSAIATVQTKLFDLITKTARTLRNICIGISSNENILVDVIRRLNKGKVTSTSFDLDVISFDFEENSDDDVKTMVKFLKINKNLTRVSWNLKESSCHRIIAALPSTLKRLRIPAKISFMTHPGYFNMFGNLESLDLFSDYLEPEVIPRHLAGYKMPKVQSLRGIFVPRLERLKILVTTFPSLQTLDVHVGGCDNGDATMILQTICRDLKLLVKLGLDFQPYAKVSDSGVTGISASHCRFLQKFKGKELVNKLREVPQNEVTGCPLSSLRRLDTLLIQSPELYITDVGLCYGFRFTSLKQLYLINQGRLASITPAGLHYIADYNQGLEKISLLSIVSMETPRNLAMVESFLDRFYRCRSSNKTVTFHEQKSERTYSLDSDANNENSSSSSSSRNYMPSLCMPDNDSSSYFDSDSEYLLN